MDTSRYAKSVVRGQTLLTVIAMGGGTWQHGSPCVDLPVLSPLPMLCVGVFVLSCVLWTVTHQLPLYIVFPRQEHWSGLPFLSAGDLNDPGMETASPTWQADSLPLSYQACTYSRVFL